MGYSLAAIFGEDTGDFNKPKIIGLDQSFPGFMFSYLSGFSIFGLINNLSANDLDQGFLQTTP